MDLTLSELPFHSLLVLPEEPTLSQLPFFLEDSVENSCLPPRPPTVCDACWEGPFAIHFGLLLLSPRSGKWYRRWPKKISYVTTWAKLETRADAGCVWCRLVLDHVGHHRYHERFTIIVRAASNTQDDGSDASDKDSLTSNSLTSDQNSDPSEEDWVTLDEDEDMSDSDSDSAQGLPLQHIIVKSSDVLQEGTRYLVYTEPKDPAASYIKTRSPIRDVGSPRALTLARQHIENCVHGHDLCKNSAYPDPRLPTRLVDCTDHTRPRLVSTTGEHGEYVTLSYVWGGDQVHKTTTANLSSYEQGIATSLLPPTIRDAIYVTHMLGFRWLWIDSLCIIQDSDEDKAHEIGRMHHIYRYSHLTIMAASANGVSESFLQERPLPDLDPHNSVTGLPFICPPRPLTSVGRAEDCSAAQFQVGTVSIAPIHSNITGRAHSDELGNMATRAWCMQEYLMSPRALIFTPQTLLFRCLSTVQGVGDSFYRIHNDPRIPNSLFLPPMAPAAEPDTEARKDTHDAWTRVVEDYTRRTASVASDKLVACAAIAEQFHGVLGSDYLAGLWRSDALLFHLLWMADPDDKEPHGYSGWQTRPTAYRAPSWSWAAIEGPTSHHVPRNLGLSDVTVTLAEVAECWVTLEDPALPFGPVMDGGLVLRGTLIPCQSSGRAEESYGDWSFPGPLPSFEQARRQWQRGHESFIMSDGHDDDDDDDNDDDDNDDDNDNDSTQPEGGTSITMDCDVDELPGRMWLVPFAWETDWPDQSDGYEVHGIVLELAPPSRSSGCQPEKTCFRRIGYFHHMARGGPSDALWGSLTRAVKDGKRPWTDIVIV